jgi:hypothetical protein
MELGTFEELGNLLLSLFSYLPVGTTILIGSLSQLRLGGLQSYSAASVKLGKKLSVKYGDSIRTLTFIPPAMGGTSNTNLIRYMADGSAWLGTLEDYPLHSYCAELEHLLNNAGREQEKGGEGLATHYEEYLYLPYSLDDYKGRYLYSPGREGLPLHLEPLSPENESSLIKTLIRELNENLVLNLDTCPNFSRSAKRPEMHCALREGRVDKALFIGGSNASKLASATAMLGVDTSKIARGGGGSQPVR